MGKRPTFRAVPLLLVFSLVWPAAVSAQYLEGSGEFGAIEVLSKLRLTESPEQVGDVAVSPDTQWAFVANLGSGSCTGEGRAGVWIVSIADLSGPQLVGFIPHANGSRPSEGMQVVSITTKFFQGDLLVMNNERCSSGGKGGVSLYDVTDPLKPHKISEHFGDRGSATHDARSAFAWDAGDRAYVAIADPTESMDVDILDITNPNRPRLVAEYDLNASGIAQPEIGLSDSRVQDMVVKQIGNAFVMLVAYMDGGFVLVDVTDPAAATLLGDTEYSNPDPQLLEATGISFPPEGNAHYAEFTADNAFFIGTDENLDPYRSTPNGPVFVGWGYVHVYDAATLAELDTFAIPEAFDPAYATGFGDLTVHEVATDPQQADRAYLAYSAGGLRAVEIMNEQIVQVGGYLDPHGNDFWGVEAFVRSGVADTLIAASDRNGGLWIFLAR